MISFNKEYFKNNCYFFLKDKGDTFSLYYSVADTLTESRKEDDKKEFPKNKLKKVKSFIKKHLTSKNKVSKKDLDSELKNIEKTEIDELIDADGTMLNSKVPFLNMTLHPKKTMDQTVVAARISNDPVTRGYRVYYGEGKENEDDILNEASLTTQERLIKQAEKDGYIRGDYGKFILNSAKEIAKDIDELNDDERNALRDFYYKKFLKKIGVKKFIKEVDYSDAFGYEETENKDFKDTVKTLKKMGVDNAIDRAKQFGKLPKQKRHNGKLKQRLVEKDSLEEEQKKRMEKMVEDILAKKYKDTSEVVEKEVGVSKIILKNLKSIKKLAEKEGISIGKLINALKSNE